jgi:condensin complex subunit 2
MSLHTANLNMSKLDSAFDIDPLFHKMSKTFDEGGAKGLLLVNLGVGTSGCNIVFDSKEEATSIASPENVPPNEAENSATLRKAEGMIDISSLKMKLDSLLNGESIQSIPLVPQLKSLRQEYEQLEKEGFVDYNAPKTNVSFVSCIQSFSISTIYSYSIICLVSSLRLFAGGRKGGGNVHSSRST